MPRHPLARLFSRSSAPRAAARPRRLLEKLEDRRLFDAAIAGDADPDAAGPEHEPPPEAADTALVSHDGQRPRAEDPNRRETASGGGDAAAARAGTPERTVRTEIVFLDPGIDDADRLLADLNAESDPDRDFEIVLLEGDGLAQIGAHLDGRGGVDAVHILSHGDAGAVRLGDVWLTADNLRAAASDIAGWGSALTADGDLLIYGCDLAGSAEGVELLDSLATLTGADVAASDDPTGHESRGGDWVLEYRSGAIEARGAISQAARDDWRHVLAVGPNVALSLPADVPIGQDFTFTATFSNTGAPGETGYGPFVDLLIPTNGTDGVGGATSGADRADGLTVTGATYLGSAVVTTELVFPDDGGGTGTVFHPYAVDAAGDPLEVTGAAGDTLIVLQLPFGSFAPEQPEAVIQLTASVSGEADLGEALTVRARGGFQYGDDPLENPASDPSIVSDEQTDATAWTNAAAVTPSLMTLTKTYNGPEDETATGPNHPQTYTITVDIADGQEITDLDVTDLLPNNLQFNRVVSVTGAGGAALAHTVAEAPPTDRPTSGGKVRVNVGSVTGGPGADDVTVVIEFHVPEFDADAYDAAGALVADPEPHRIIPVSGEDDGPPSVIENNASALGDWDPADDRDAGGTDNASADPDPNGPEHTLDGKSIAVQKSVANVTDSSNTPGDVLEYTIRFQISDYFTFGDLRLDDLFSDGQRFDFGRAATFNVTDRGVTTIGEFAVGRTGSPGPEANTYDPDAHTLKVDESRIDFADDANEQGASDGKTALTFDLSKALKGWARSNHADGILQGGRTVSETDGAAFGTITFYTKIQQDFADTFPSGDRSVDHGDRIANEVDITGVARRNDDHAVELATETDDSAAGVSIAGGSFAKGIAFINGSAPVAGQTVRPGDTVTYELQYDLPSSDFEGLTLTDYLPQPVFEAGDPDADGSAGPAWTFDATNQGTAPASGVVRLGANDTFYASEPGSSDYFDSAAISVESGNAVKFDFGTYDDPTDQQTTIHLLFTVTVSDAPFADGLQLTNIARAEESNTSSEASSQDEIVQIELGEPDVKITKGAVSSDSADADFGGPVGPGTATFNGPGTGGFTGAITSADLAAAAVDADVTGLDAGDRVKFAVVLENVGGADASDLVVSDLLPAGFRLPGGAEGGVNLTVQNGDGTALTFVELGSGAGAGLFGAGIRIDDPAGREGAANALADAQAAGDGSNIVVVTYDLILTDAVTADQSGDSRPAASLENAATLSNYAGVEGGRDHTTVDRTDAATAATRPFVLQKRIVATSESHTGEVSGTERVTIGEIVRYRLTVEVPEGTHANFRVTDLLPGGMAFLEDGTATLAFVSDGALTAAGLAGAQQSGDETTVDDLSPTFQLSDARIASQGGADRWDAGDDPTFDLGTLTNADDDGDLEFVVIEFNAVAANADSNTQDKNRAGAFEAAADDVATVTGDSVDVTIAEPLVTITQTRDKPQADAGDTVTFTLTLTADDAAERATAFDVRLANALPDGLTNLRDLTVTGGAGVTNAAGAISNAGDGYTVTADAMAGGSVLTVTFRADLKSDVEPTDTIANHGDLTWTSLKGDHGDETPAWAGTAATSSQLRTLDADSQSFSGGDGNARTYSTTPGGFHGERTGADHDHAAGTNSGTNDYGRRATASLSVPAAVYGKTLFATSDAHTAGSDATIGEAVTFALRVELPEGETPNLRITDLIPPGLDYESFQLVTTRAASQNEAGTFLLDADFNGGVSDPAATGGANAGDDVTFAFGAITVNAGDEAGTGNDDAFLLLVHARVADVGTNAGKASGSQTSIVNTAEFDTDGDGTAEATHSAAAAVVEPDLTVTKTMSPGTGAEAGDTVTVSFTVENTGLADAFDLTIADDLADGLFENVAKGTTPAGFTYSLAGDVVTYTGPTLAAGDTVTFTFTARLTQAVGPNQTIPNTATADYSTRAGDQGANERDDADNGSTTLTTAPPEFSKVLFATSEDGTSGSDAAVGETVTYALVVDLPEGTTAGLSLVDLLPDGLDYTGFRLVTTAAGSTPDGGSPLLTENFDGTRNGVALKAADFTVTGGAADGADVTFSVGEIVMPADGDAGRNQFLLLVDAVVTDRTSNEGKLPGRTALTNAATLDLAGDTDANGDAIGPQSSNAVTVTVAEPDLVVTKTATAAANRDGGDTVRYTVTVAHTAASAADARDLVLTDLLTDADLSLVAGTVTTNLGSIVTGNAAGDATLRVDLSRLEDGQTLTVTFDAKLAGDAAFGDAVSNTAVADYDGLGGAGGRADQKTIAESVTLDRPTIEKDRVGTSVGSGSNAALDEAVVGESVTYRVTVTLPEGRADGATILDSLDPNLEFDAVQSVTLNGDLTSTAGDPATPSDFDPAISGNDLSFDFGTLTNPTTDAGGPQTVVLEYTARVKNVAAVQGETPTVLDGTAARFQWTLNGADTPTTADTAGNVTVIEPTLGVTVTSTDAAGDAGEAVVYTITVDHTGVSETDAFDVTFNDPLPDELTVTGFTVIHSTLGDISGRFEHDAATNTLRTKAGESFDLALAEDLTVTLNTTVNGDAEAGETIAHTPAVAWTSLDNTPAGERTGAGGVNDYAASTAAPTFAVDRPAFVKSLVGTSATGAGNGATDAAIGELVTYRLEVTVPEGTTADAVIADTLDAGLAFVRVVSVDAFSGGAATADLTSSATDFAPTVTGDGTAADQVLSFDLGTLTNADRDDAKAETFVILYEARALNVASNDGTAASPTSLGSSARLNYTADGAAQNTADSDSTAVEVVEPVLTIDTEVDDDTPQLGQTVTYTLTIEHAADSDATAHDLRVTDLLPPGVTLNTASVSVIGATVLANDTAGQTVDLTLDELAPGGTTTVTFTAVVTSDPAEIGTTFHDDADLTWTSLDGTAGSGTSGERTGAGGVNDYADDDTDPLTIKNPDLSVTITDGETEVAPGESRTYLVTVTNGNGPHSADATGVSVALPIPGDIYALTGTDDAANVSVDGDGTLTWTPTGALPPGSSVTLEVTVRANDAQPAGADDVTLTATVTMDQVEPTPADTVRSDTDALDAAPDLFVATDDGGATTAPNGSVVYTTTYGNRGPQAATGAVVRQTLPPGTTFDAANSAGWVESSTTPGLYELTLGDLAVGATGSVNFAVTVDAEHPAGRHELTTTATIADDDANGPEPAAGVGHDDETDGDTTPLNAVPELSVTIADDADPAVPDGTVTYTLSYANAGPQGATGTTLTFTPPAGTTFDAANLTNGWTDAGNGTFTFGLGGLAPDGSDDGSVNVTVTVDSTHPAGRYELTAAVSVADDGTNGPEANTANNAAAEPTTLTAAPDLTVTLSAPTATAGDPLTYTFDYENLGDQGATGVTLTFTPPPGVTIDPAANPLWTDQGDGTWTRPLPDAAAEGTGSVTFTVNVVDPVTAGRETFAATALIGEDGTNGPDPAPNDTSSISTALDAAPDLFATIDDGRASATTKDVLTYAIAYGNAGDQHSTGAVLTVTPPPHTAVDAATAAVWTDNGDGTWSVSVGDLNAAGASNGSTSFTVRVNDSVPATVENLTATVSIADDGNSGPDADATNDGDSDVDVLSTAPDYFVTTTDDVPAGGSIRPGQTLTYTLAYGNKPNLQDGTGVVLTHTVPAGTGYDTANDGRGWAFKETNGDGLAVYQLAVGPVSSGAGGTATFSVIVDDTADALREQLVAAAAIGDDGNNGVDPAPADNTEPEATPLTARVDLAVTVDDGDAGLVPGQTLDLTVGYDNLGDQDAADATLALAPPAGTTVSVADAAFNAGLGWSESGGVWTNSLGNLPASDPAGSVLFRVTVDDPVTAGREKIDSAATIADAGTTEPDLDTTDNAAADSDPLTAAPDLTLTVTPDVNDAGVGDTVTYTLDFENVGDQHASGTTLTFVVPPGTVGAPANTADGWVDQGGGVWTLDLDQLDADETGSVSFATTVAGPVIADRETEDATATLADDGAGTPSTGSVTDQQITPLGFDAIPDLVVDTTDHDLDAYAGELLEYTVTVTNAGDQAANGVQVVHTIPEGTELSDDALAGGWVDRGDGFAVLELGTVTPGAPATVPFSVRVDARQPALRERFDATATVADVGSPGNPAEADPTPADNVDAEPTPLDAAPDYVVTISDQPGAARPGDPVSWTITLRNVGGQDGTGVVLTDEFPPDLLTNVRASGGGVVNAAAGTIRWDFAELAGAGGTVVLTVTGTIPNGATGGELTHRAAVTDDLENGPDVTPANNRASDATTVTAFAFDSFRSAADGAWGGFGAFGGGFGAAAAPAGGGGDRYATDSPAKPLGGLLPTRGSLWRALPRVPVDPMFSGTAEPGTLLTAKVYDADGRLVAERQVMADTAGNWLMSFPGTVFYEQPQKMEFSRTAAVGSTGAGVNEADAQFALRRFFHPVTHATLFFTENPTVGGALGGAAGQRLDAAHRANRHPLGTGTAVRAWNLAAASATAGQA